MRLIIFVIDFIFAGTGDVSVGNAAVCSFFFLLLLLKKEGQYMLLLICFSHVWQLRKGLNDK